MKKKSIPEVLLKLANGPVTTVNLSATEVTDIKFLLIEAEIQYNYKITKFLPVTKKYVYIEIQRTGGDKQDLGADETSRSGDYRKYRKVLELRKQDTILCVVRHAYPHDHVVTIKEKKTKEDKILAPLSHWDTHGITDPRGIIF